ncbi:MAG TPA: SelB C-terminal domain-containing protein, partial [Castellaniella sp.]|nr:SelB C-terminal domain-containing protein [Castellaniella sp.]
ERHSGTGILTGLLESDEGGLDLPRFARALNLTPAGMTAALQGTRAVVLGRQASIGLSPGHAEALTMRALEAIRFFHHEHPQAPGIPLDSLRARAAPQLSRTTFQAFIRDLANRQHLVLSNDRLSLRDHDTTAGAQDEALWARVRTALQTTGAHCPLLAELAESLHVAEPLLRDFLHRKSRSGEVRHITANRFCLRTTLEDLASTAESVARDRPDGSFTAAEFRDAIGTGRGLAIHYLEFFDQIGVTRRSGDQRRMAEHPMEPLRAGSTAPAEISPESPHSSQVHP